MGSMASWSREGGFQTQADPGMIPRVVNHLFAKMEADVDNTYTLKLSYIQIYQDDVYVSTPSAPSASLPRGASVDLYQCPPPLPPPARVLSRLAWRRV
jgi:hypothetical protein